ncbi:hypothetical protein [Burkholderia pyrrocinia]|uniref:hypothetical protein n=1 Tax=Burkholderia pyrrocinia TaxID=60550 RepID=UPI00064BE9F9|nr:hypothetical protein [Burkholderia pyrrocinia]AKM04737.1 hypothetical protein ABD05_31240 [Burkholderia pyrrocinia]
MIARGQVFAAVFGPDGRGKRRDSPSVLHNEVARLQTNGKGRFIAELQEQARQMDASLKRLIAPTPDAPGEA